MSKGKQILKKVLIGLSLIALSFFIGGGYAIYSLKSESKNDGFALQLGSWKVNPKMDLNNRYERALISLIALFALRESEVLYFLATQDSEGRPLESKYDYELDGSIIDARYWSYTLYGHDYFLVKNDIDKFGFNLDNIAFENDSTSNLEVFIKEQKKHKLIISSSEKAGNWLPSGNESQFFITLRMYNPSPDVYEHLETLELPLIKRID